MSDQKSGCVHSTYVREFAHYVPTLYLHQLRSKYGNELLRDTLRGMALLEASMGHFLPNDKKRLLEPFLTACEDCRLAFAEGIADRVEDLSREEQSA